MSLFEPAVQEAFACLGADLPRAEGHAEMAATCRHAVAQMSPADFNDLSDELRSIAWSYRPNTEGPLKGWRRVWRMLTRKRVATPDMLAEHPDLAWLLMFHGNGYIRQAAVEALQGPPQSPLEFVALVCRLNDWVGAVRASALERCRALLADADPAVICEAAFWLQPHMMVLNRIEDEAKALVVEVTYRADVLALMKADFMGTRGGSVGRTFRRVLSRPGLDDSLLAFSTQAALPAIRAAATSALLEQKATWFTGYGKQWVDKRYGISRRTSQFASRPITVAVDARQVLETASKDRSSQVRKVAADALIERVEGSDSARDPAHYPALDAIATTLLNDPKASVASRAAFYLKKRGL